MNTELEKLGQALRKNGFDTKIFADRQEVTAALLSEIGDRSVGFGGSKTVDELGVYDVLRQQGNAVSWHWKESDKDQARRRASASDVYLASSNAVTMEGHLVNIDGSGNRVASMVWGPKEVILVIGSNKMAADHMGAIERIKTEACGKNARRLGLKTPCAELDRCTDCSSPDRMCGVTTLIERKPHGVERFQVYLVDEALGF